MRLRRLDLRRYGRFTDYSLDFGPRGEGTDLHIVYGLNEAGKSTAFTGYLDLLYGIEERTPYGFLHGYGAMELGGALEFGGEVHELVRLKKRAGSLRDAAGLPLPEGFLAAPLAGLSRESYRAMFSLDDETLERGGEDILDSRGDLGALLFSASAGLADLGRALQGLDDEAKGIFRKHGKDTRIVDLKRRIEALRARRQEIDVQASAFARLTAQLKQAAEAYESALGERATARARREDLARLLRAAPLADEHRRLAADLAALGPLPRPPAPWAEELPALWAEAAQRATRRDELARRAAQIEAAMAAITVDHRLIALGDRLDRLAEAAARFSTAEDDLPKRRAVLAERTAQIAGLVHALGRVDAADPATLPIPAATLAQLRALIEARAGVEAAAAAAESERAAAALALAAAEEEGAALAATRPPLAPARVAALQTALARLREGDLPTRRRLAEAELARSRDRRDAARAALAPWTGPAAALDLPDAARIDGWRRRLAELEQDLARCAERLAEAEAARGECAARAEALREAAGGIDDARAAALRAARDAAWDRHLAALDAETARAFAQALGETDALAELRIARARDLAELRGLAAETAAAEARIAEQGARRAALETRRTALGEDLRRALPDGGLHPDAPPAEAIAAAENWAERRRAAAAAEAELAEAEAEAARAAAEAAGEAARLAETLAAAGVAAEAELADLGPGALAQAAENALAENAGRDAMREAADRTLRDRRRDLAARASTAAVAQAAREAWLGGWRAALAETWFADRAESPAAVRPLLDLLADLPAALRERTEIDRRIAAMETDRRAFLAELAALHAGLDLPAPDPAAPLDAARRLAQARERALQAQDRLREKAEARAALAEERAAVEAEAALHDARRDAIFALLAVADFPAADAALRRCAARDRLEEERDRVAARLCAETAAASLEAALTALADADLVAARREHEALDRSLEDLDGRLNALFADRSRAEDGLAAIGGDDAAARVEAERRTALLEIEDLALRWLRLRTGARVAEEALRAFRERHRSAMMDRASEAFRAMTRGAYAGLTTRLEKDSDTLIGVTRDGGSKLAADMSKGTRFQLYLALRLAGYAEFAALRPPAPFIADDIMETFDEPRSEEVFRLFARMGEIGQVIYLTHHRHLCDIAAAAAPGVRIHDLGP